MANSRKKISELPALSVASLDTTFVLGISGSTTYKISINNLTSSLDTTFATDLVTNALSSSLNSKLSTSSFNSYTSSFTASVASGTISGSSQLTSSFDTRYVVSGSITQTTWDNIANKPSGIVSQSTDLSPLNTFTQSIDSRVDSLENSTGSYLTSLSGAISSSTQISDLGFVTGSYTTINSFNSLTQSFNSISQSFNVISGSVGTVDFNGVVSSSAQITTFGFVSGSYETTGRGIISSSANLVTTSSFNSYTASISTASLVTSISNLNSATSSYLTSLSGAISSSSQLTSSFDTRYVASGSISAVPAGTISGSAQITAFGFISSSTTIDTGSLVTTSSFNSYTASLNAFSSSLSVTANSSTKILDAYYTNAAAWSGSYSGNGGTVKVEANFALYSTSIGTKTFTLFRNGIAVDSGSFYFNNTGVHTTMPTLYYIGTNETGTNTYSVGHNAVSDAGDSCNIVVTETFNTLNAGLISGSAQITALGFVSGSYETTGRGILSGSVSYTSLTNIPLGIVSGSSQLTSSFPSKTTGTWSVPNGASTQSFSVESGASYTMWVNGNIPNGIITWNATVTTSNTNVPVVGSQHGWYYSAGNALVLTTMPDQITGTNGSIVNTPASYAPNTSNVFKFGITNNSGASQTINYGYIKLS